MAQRPVMYIDGDESFTNGGIEAAIGSEVSMKREKDYDFFAKFDGIIRRPVCPDGCEHNAHMYYILFNELETRTRFINFMKSNDVSPVFHYIPLHSSPAGRRFGRVHGENLPVTDKISDTLVRLPMFYELSVENMSKIKGLCTEFFTNIIRENTNQS